jgi:hypothetical protein
VLPSNSRARSFLQRAETSKERRYESVGCGTVHQFEGETVVGSALICDRRVINISFFNSKERLLPPPGVSK